MSLLFHGPRLHVAHGAIARALATELKRRTVKRLLLIVEGSAGFSAELERLKNWLPEEIEVVLLQKANGTPNAATVAGALELFALEDCDAVVAAGGQAVMNFARRVTRGLADHDPGGDAYGWRDGPLPFFAIPGDLEAIRSLGPVVIAPDGDRDALSPSFDPGLLPDVVICDKDFIQLGSPLASAALGMCILSDCIEAYSVHRDNPLADALAFDAIRRILTYLEQVASSTQTSTSGDLLMTALLECTFAMQKGMGAVRAIENAVAFAHPGAAAPGNVSSAILPIVLEFNAGGNDGIPAGIREALGQPLVGPAAYVRLLAERLKLPTWLSELGIRREDIGALARLAFFDINTETNPRRLAIEDYTTLLGASFPRQA